MHVAVPKGWLVTGIIFSLSTLVAIGQPGYGEPLTNVHGTVYRVGTISQLQNAVDAVNSAGVPATILVSNGTYVLTIPSLNMYCDNVIVRSLSGDRDAVVIRGPDEGPAAFAEHIFRVTATHVTIADMTFGWCRCHGVQAYGHTGYNASNLWVHNCRIVNCNEQFIKGTSEDADPEGVTDGLVENCLFEFTNRWAYQYYTGGIDVHKAVNWVVRDNLFLYIRSPDEYPAEHAIHFWKRCTTRPQSIVVERNIALYCDRGIGFGLTDFDGGHNGGASVIRNNIVYNDGVGPYTDVGIGLEYADNVKVDNNTVSVPYWAPIEYRFPGSSNLVFRNNLVNDAITARDGAPAPGLSNNLENAQAGWFRCLTNGDLHIKPGVTGVLNQGCAIADFADDVDGTIRPVGVAWDIGADEYDPSTTDTDGDGMRDDWELLHRLNPTNAADAEWDDDDDTFCNLDEYVAETDPTNDASFFRTTVLQDGLSIGILPVPDSSNRLYTLSFSTNLPQGNWFPLTGFISVPGGDGPFIPDDSAGFAVYRVQVESP